MSQQIKKLESQIRHAIAIIKMIAHLKNIVPHHNLTPDEKTKFMLNNHQMIGALTERLNKFPEHVIQIAQKNIDDDKHANSLVEKLRAFEQRLLNQDKEAHEEFARMRAEKDKADNEMLLILIDYFFDTTKFVFDEPKSDKKKGIFNYWRKK